MPRPHSADQWSALDPWIGDGVFRPVGARPWVPDLDARRLAAYQFLASLRDNASRYFLPYDPASPSADMAMVNRFREYGDPGLLVSRARSAVLGRSQTITVDDAPTGPFATWLDGWANSSRLPLRLTEAETDATGLGDAVFALGWDARTRRPALEVHDPGWYFPDLDSVDGEYPTTVHAAWEEKDPKTGNTWLVRRTWRLVPATAYRLPWQMPEAPNADRVCLYTAARWELGKLTGDGTVFDLSTKSAVYDKDPLTGDELKDVSLGVDFVPVVHMPNDAAGRRHFGTSLLTKVAQLAWDAAQTDTDLQVGSELFGSSAMVTKGTGLGPTLDASPTARRWEIPADGSVELLDTSRTLVAMTQYDTHLLERLSQNSQLTGAYLGREKLAQVASGYLLELGFTPLDGLVRDSRQVRDQKLPLVLKFAGRLAMVNKALEAGPLPAARIALGPYLPADLAAVVDRVTKLLPISAISTPTAVDWLVEAGLKFDDAKKEVERIHQEAADRAALAPKTPATPPADPPQPSPPGGPTP